MSASILLQGKLERGPEARTSRNGNSFITATLRVASGGDLQFWRLFVFSESAQTELARVGEGDALTVQGTPKFEIWHPESGAPRVSLSATVDHVLALKQPSRKRDPKADNSARPDRARGDLPSPPLIPISTIGFRFDGGAGQ